MAAMFAWGAVALVLSAALTALCMPLARRLGAVARPRADRWNRHEIPLLGGIAIVVATTLPLLAAGGGNPRLRILLLGAAMIAAVGLIDDLRRIKPPTKLLGQLLAATLVVGMGLRLSLTGSTELDMLLTIAWLVGMSNAFNLLDNMDGLAAGIAAIAAAFRLLFFYLDGDHQDASGAAILLGATLGFLVFNRNPARIFMGDTGSMFLGFFVAGLSLVGEYAYSRGTISILLIPVLLLLVPIFDTAFVTATRILAGRPIYVGGRDHTSHRLVALGLSEKQAVGLLYLLAIVSGTIATVSYQYGFSRSAVLITLLVLGVALLALYLSRVPVRPDDARVERAPLVRLVADFSHKWQVATVLLDFVLIVAAYHAAYVLRFEDDLAQFEPRFLESLPIVIGFQLLCLTLYRAQQSLWRYTSLTDLLRILKASSIGTLLAVGGVVLAFRFEGYSRSVFVLDWVLLTSFLCASRLSFRLLGEVLRPMPADSRRILIYGAGDAGELAAREMLQNPALGRQPVAFLDDDPAKQRRRIRGLPVIAGVEGVEAAVRLQSIHEVVVASQKIPEQRVQRVAEVCESYGVPVVRVVLRLEATERVA